MNEVPHGRLPQLGISPDEFLTLDSLLLHHRFLHHLWWLNLRDSVSYA
jgi:hypothetical protein